jgi:hypothetical protein
LRVRIQGRIDLDGAVITVWISAGVAEAAHLEADAGPGVAAIGVTALIDTGASRTAIHPMIVRQLGLVPRDFTTVEVPGEQGPVVKRYNLYDITVKLPERGPGPEFPIQAVEIVPATPSVLVLIGRDILEYGTLLFDGENWAFSLWA